MSADYVYLDYAATTPLDPGVATLMGRFLADDSNYANPSAVHVAGRAASAFVGRATSQLASLLKCDPDSLVWTSGATESNNIAILGAANFRAHRGRHLVTMPTEHSAVTDVFRALEGQGFEVTWLAPDADGRLDLADLDAAIRDDTQLVSIMYVNNETGVMQDIAAIGDRCRQSDVLFHVDAAQAVGKLPIDLDTLPVDLMSMTAHKLYGPKGIGALYLGERPGCHVEPLMFGGGQQRRLRPGTLPVPLIAAFGLAAEIAAAEMPADLAHVAALEQRLWSGLEHIPGVLWNGHRQHRYPGILNVSIDDIEGESLLLGLEPLCVATGSACNSRSQEPSYVLRALGRDDGLAQSAIRFSYGRMSSEADIDFAIERYCQTVEKLRELAPGAAA